MELHNILEEKIDEKEIIPIIESYIGENKIIQCINCNDKDIENNDNFPFYCFSCKSYICNDCYYNFKRSMFCSKTSCIECFNECNKSFYHRCHKCDVLLCKICCFNREERIRPYEDIDANAQLFCLDCIFSL